MSRSKLYGKTWHVSFNVSALFIAVDPLLSELQVSGTLAV